MNLLRTLLIVVLGAIVPVSTTAGVKMTKEQKEVCKTLKKSLGAANVEPFENAPDSPYYEVMTAGPKFGIYDREGKVIVAPEYDKVLYIPAVEGSSVKVHRKDKKNKKSELTIALPTAPSADGFWGFSKEKGARVFDRQGTLVASFPHTSATYFGNYLYLESAPYVLVYEDLAGDDGFNPPSVFLYSQFRKDGYGHGILVRADGSVIIPEIDRASFYEGNPYLIYTKIGDDKVNYYGMKVVTDQRYNEAPANYSEYVFADGWVDINVNDFVSEIPPVFYQVDCRKGVWKISDKPSDMRSTTKVFTPEIIKSASVIRDPGEAFYVRGQYDDVLIYYSEEGLAAPWAPFYSAEALLAKSHPSRLRFRNVVEAMERGSGLPANEQEVISDVNVIQQMIMTAGNLLNKYLNSGETEFKEEATSSKGVTEYLLQELQEYVDRYNKVRSHAAMVTSQEEARQAAYMQAVLNAFSNIMSSVSSSSGRNSSSTASYSTSGSSGSYSGGSSAGEDNSSRKSFLKGQIADWRNKLKKAEQSYEQAMSSGDDSWQKKKVLESKQRTIDECANMIRQYESELNSLK